MLLFEHDLSFLLQSVERVINNRKEGKLPTFVEIGLHQGGTAQALITKIHSLIGSQFTYYGIDPQSHKGIHPLVEVINKPSHLAVDDIPPILDWVFVDGCHCSECVIRDVVLYGSRLRVDGEICFHDASPATQGRDPQDYSFMDDYHNVDFARKGIAVRYVLDRIIRKMTIFKLIEPSLNQEYGGVEIYRRVENGNS